MAQAFRIEHHNEIYHSSFHKTIDALQDYLQKLVDEGRLLAELGVATGKNIEVSVIDVPQGGQLQVWLAQRTPVLVCFEARVLDLETRYLVPAAKMVIDIPERHNPDHGAFRDLDLRPL